MVSYKGLTSLGTITRKRVGPPHTVTFFAEQKKRQHATAGAKGVIFLFKVWSLSERR